MNRVFYGLVLAVVFRAAEAAGAAPTYHGEVAPILEGRCQGCHRPGEVAPMSLLSYAEARPWAESIKEEVAAKRMPPWHADPRHGKFANDPTLTQAEIDTLVRWADAGAPEGEAKGERPPRAFVDGWNIPSPDVVFSMPQEFQVPAAGVVRYQYFLVPTGFTEDCWVQYAEVRPGNRAVVHHVIVFLVKAGVSARDARRGNLLENFLVGVAPGEGPTVFPEGTGKLIPAGSSVLFQVHYTPNGKAAVDRSSVGLVFARSEVKREVKSRAIMNQLLFIPPGAEDHPVASQYTFGKDSQLVSLMPHMHLRGKSFEYRAAFPDGTERVLLSVPKWDFNWQHVYRLAEPMPMPRGTVIRCLATYDNSPRNKSNPDPTAAVRWGDQTWEEMMIGFIDFTREAPPPARRQRV